MAKRKEAQPAMPPDAPSMPPMPRDAGQGQCAAAGSGPGGIVTVDVTLPLGEVGEGYFAPNFDVQLTHDQARTLRRILEGLKAVDAKARNGRGPRDPADAIAYLLELVSRAEGATAPQAEGDAE